MDQIKTLIEIANNYHINGKHWHKCISFVNAGMWHIIHGEDYDKHYRICYEAATNFINTSNVFSELKPEEIIKAFANMEFKDNSIFIHSSIRILYYHGMLMNHASDHLKLFEELLKVNKEMLLALIKAINDKKIMYDRSHYFIDDNCVLGVRDGITDNEMIKLYRILLEYNHFSLDNLNLGNILIDIRPPITKRAI